MSLTETMESMRLFVAVLTQLLIASATSTGFTKSPSILLSEM
jgi:hypothetical protein